MTGGGVIPLYSPSRCQKTVEEEVCESVTLTVSAVFGLSDRRSKIACYESEYR